MRRAHAHAHTHTHTHAQVSLELQLDQESGAAYTVVGSTFEPGQGASFMFYVYTDAPHDVVALDADWRGARDEQKPEVLHGRDGTRPPHHATPPVMLHPLTTPHPCRAIPSPRPSAPPTAPLPSSPRPSAPLTLPFCTSPGDAHHDGATSLARPDAALAAVELLPSAADRAPRRTAFLPARPDA